MKTSLRISDQVLWLASSTILAQGMQIGANAVLVRLITKDEVGLYRQVFLIIGIVAPLFSMGLSSSIYYFTPSLQSVQRKSFLFQTWILQIIGGLLTSLGILLLADPIAMLFGNVNLAPSLRACSFFPLFSIPFSTSRQILLSIQKPIWASVIVIVNSLGQPVFVVVLLLFDVKFPEIYYWLTLSAALRVIGFFLICVRSDTSPINISIASVKSQLSFSLPLATTEIIGQLTENIDNVIISAFFTAAEYATYSVGAFQLPFVALIATPILDVVLPRIASFWHQNDTNTFFSLWHESMRKTALIVFPMTTFFFIFSYPAFTLLFTDNYLDSVIIFQIYLLVMPNKITQFSSVLTTMGVSRPVALLFAFNVFVKFALGIILVYWIGFVGPAISYALLPYFHNTMQLILIMRTAKKSLREVLPWNSLLGILCLSMGVGVITYPMVFLPLRPVFILSLGIGVYSVLYLVIGYFSKVVMVRDFEHAAGLVTRLRTYLHDLKGF